MNRTWKFILIIFVIAIIVLAYFVYRAYMPQLALNQLSLSDIDKGDPEYKKKQDPIMAKDLNDYFYKNPTKIRFIQDLYDFDTVKKGVNVIKKINYINEGAQPYFISEIKVSCGCTIPTYSKEPVKPGDTGVVHVEFKSAKKDGFVMNKLSLYGNTETHENSVYFKVYVK